MSSNLVTPNNLVMPNNLVTPNNLVMSSNLIELTISNISENYILFRNYNRIVIS
jgi:hypothetical protein